MPERIRIWQIYSDPYGSGSTALPINKSWVDEESLVSRAGHATTLPRQSDQKIVDNDLICTVYSLWLYHLDTETFQFVVFFLDPDLLLCCRVVVVAKLNSCRVPSPVIFYSLLVLDDYQWCHGGLTTAGSTWDNLHTWEPGEASGNEEGESRKFRMII